MRNLRTVAVILPLLFCACNQEREELPTRGSMVGLVCESQHAVLLREEEEFERLYPDARVTLTATSTRDAIVQLLNDSVAFICVDRPLNDEERAVARRAQLSFTEILMAEDALGVVVHPDNPLTDLSVEQVRDVFAGSTREWQALSGGTFEGSILPIVTGRNSGTHELLMRQFLKLPGDPRLAAIADSQRAVLDYVATHRGALGIVPVAALRDTAQRDTAQRDLARSVRVLALRTTDSTGATITAALHQANIHQRIYPLHYPVYVYVRAESRGVPSGFATFMASAPGQKLFLSAGLVPATMPVRLVSLHPTEEE